MCSAPTWRPDFAPSSDRSARRPPRRRRGRRRRRDRRRARPGRPTRRRGRRLIDVNLHGVAAAGRGDGPGMIRPAAAGSSRRLRRRPARDAPARRLLGGQGGHRSAYVRALAADLAGTGVLANVVCPGSTRGAMLAASADVYDLAGQEDFAGQQLVRRLLEPREVAAAVVWLCGPAGFGLDRCGASGRRRADRSTRPLEPPVPAGWRLRLDPGVAVGRETDEVLLGGSPPARPHAVATRGRPGLGLAGRPPGRRGSGQERAAGTAAARRGPRPPRAAAAARGCPAR